MKTNTELAREAGIRDCTCSGTKGCLDRLVEFARADERRRLLAGVEMPEPDGMDDDDTCYYTADQLREFAAAAVARKDADIAALTKGIGNAQLAAYIEKHGEPVPMVAERDALKAELDRLKIAQEFFLERWAQRDRRLWSWAHEELSEELKSRYFNIVANGTADYKEQPIYAQQFNVMKHRAKKAEAEVERLKARRMPLTEEQKKAIAESAINGHAGTRAAIVWAIGYAERLRGIKEHP